MRVRLSRQEALGLALVPLGGVTPRTEGAAARRTRYCLNTGTLRGHRLSLADSVGIAKAAGYDGIEPWLDEIERAAAPPGGLADVSSRIRDAGLRIEGAIGFAEWIVDDADRRARGLERLRRDMDLVARIGGTRIAAPPAGATDAAGLSVTTMAARYRGILDIGRQIGVTPQLEVWGFSKTLGRLSEAAAVAIEADQPDACILADVFHLYKGGSGFAGLAQLSGAAMHVFHMNDYPADPPRDRIRDADRLLPGDGVAPLASVVGGLIGSGFVGAFSLEVFNDAFRSRPAIDVAREGLRKMKAACGPQQR